MSQNPIVQACILLLEQTALFQNRYDPLGQALLQARNAKLLLRFGVFFLWLEGFLLWWFGWDIEAAVPISHLPSGTLAEGHHIRMTFGYRDDDDGGTWEARMLWEGDDQNNNPATHYGYLALVGEGGAQR